MPEDRMRSSIRGAALVALVTVSACATRPAQSPTTTDSAGAVAAVERFHSALRAGDSSSVTALLTQDVVVLESGDMEDRAAYIAHHLPADIEFAKATTEQRDPAQVTIRGDVAWVASTGRTRGTFRGRDVNSASAELVVLVRTPSGWRIAAVHWSSHRASS